MTIETSTVTAITMGMAMDVTRGGARATTTTMVAIGHPARIHDNDVENNNVWHVNLKIITNNGIKCALNLDLSNS
jgi:hypothetical protein